MIRAEMSRKRNELGTAEANALSERVQRLALASQTFVDAGKVASYIATAKEVATAMIHSECHRLSKLLAVPYKSESDNLYHFAGIDRSTALRKGTYGIYEPAKPRHFDLEELQIAFIPGVAFDREGRRLGHGKGIYDELLKGFMGTRIGLAFSFQCVEALPEEPHDIRMDCIINENGFLKRLNKTIKSGRCIPER